tara:strand:- start:355 stop:540 length:186 start_codon:yes stop_codon:yes gene_type:complete
MNWIKLKEKFPNSEKEIREFYNNSVVKDSRIVLNNFLKTKGYNMEFTFIDKLKNYEQYRNN